MSEIKPSDRTAHHSPSARSEAEFREPYREAAVESLLQIISSKPGACAALQNFLSKTVFGSSRLSEFHKQLLARTVAALSRREVVNHSFSGLDQNHDLPGLAGKPTEPGLAAEHRVMLAYAEKLTTNCRAMTKADLDNLRTFYSEDEVYDIVVLTATFNCLERALRAFGVKEPWDKTSRPLLLSQ
jgi:hypothetical protein